MNAICRTCFALLTPGNVFCTNCGRPVAESVSVAEVPTVVVPRSRSPKKVVPRVSAKRLAGWLLSALILAIIGGILISAFQGGSPNGLQTSSANSEQANNSARWRSSFDKTNSQ